MTVSHTPGSHAAGAPAPDGRDGRPTPADLDGMSRDEIAVLAARLDDVEIVHNQR